MANILLSSVNSHVCLLGKRAGQTKNSWSLFQMPTQEKLSKNIPGSVLMLDSIWDDMNNSSHNCDNLKAPNSKCYNSGTNYDTELKFGDCSCIICISMCAKKEKILRGWIT